MKLIAILVVVLMVMGGLTTVYVASTVHASPAIQPFATSNNNGSIITIKTLNFFPQDYDAAQVVYNDLKAAGLNVQLLEEGSSELYPSVENSFQFDIYINAFPNSPFPSMMFQAFQSWDNYPDGLDTTGFSNSTINEITNSTESSSNYTSFLNGLYEMEDVVSQQLPMIGLFTSNNTQLVNTGWTGYAKMPGGEFTPYNIYSATDLHHSNNTPGGTFTLAYPGPINHLNPFAQTSFRGEYFTMLIYDTLFKYAQNMSIIPWLVNNYTVSANGTVYTMNLHHNVNFTNGQKLTAQDVAFSYNYAIQTKALLFYDYIDMIKNITTDGNYTVIFHLSHPYRGFLPIMTIIPIVEESQWAGTNLTYTNPNPIGSGPFEFKTSTPGQSWELVANPHYWNTQYQPKISNFNIVYVSSETTRVLEIERGDAGAELYATPPQTAESAVSSYPSNVKIIDTADIWQMYLYFNLRQFPMNNLTFRQAVAYAINKTAIVASYGAGVPMVDSFVNQAWNPGMISPTIVNYSYDPALAHSMFRELGLVKVSNSYTLYYIIGAVVALVVVGVGTIYWRRSKK